MIQVGSIVKYTGNGYSISKFKTYKVYSIDKDYARLENVNNRVAIKYLELSNEDELLNGFQEEFNRRVKGKTGTCHYALKFSDGTTRYQISDVCHARLRRFGEEKEIDEVILNVGNHYRDCITEEYKSDYKNYVDFIINKSVWSKAFIKDNIDNVINSNIRLNVDANNSLCVSAAIALRIGSEYPSQCKAWNVLTKRGIDPHIAFIVASSLANSDYLADKFQVNRGMYGHHHVINLSNSSWSEIFDTFISGVTIDLDNGRSLRKSIGEYSISQIIAKYKDNNQYYTKLLKAVPSKYVETTKDYWGDKHSAIVLDNNSLYEYAVTVMQMILKKEL